MSNTEILARLAELGKNSDFAKSRILSLKNSGYGLKAIYEKLKSEGFILNAPTS